MAFERSTTMKHRFHSNPRHAVAVTAAALGLLGASAVAATPRPSSSAESAPAAVTETTAHGSIIRDLSLPTSPVPPTPCRDLMSGAACHTLAADAAAFVERHALVPTIGDMLAADAAEVAA
jgi:hypothetical protein